MYPTRFSDISRLLLVLFLGSGSLWAADQPLSSTRSVAPATSEQRLVTSFTPLAGSEENARSLVQGLRSGGSITLYPSPNQPLDTASAFVVPTRPMGYGNVRIALSLADARLAAEGITQPTPAELQGALVGFPDGTQTGILQMRSEGQGWGQIAHQMGFRLGAVMSGKVQVLPVQSATGTHKGGATGSTVTSAGTRASTGKSGTSASSGITTAAGARMGGGVTNSMGQGIGHAYGRAPAVNSGGGAHGATQAQGGGAAHGKGKP